MNATPQRDGYVRYIRFGDDESNIVGGIRLDYTAWVENEISPIWLESGDDANADLREIFKKVALECNITREERRSKVMLPLDIEMGQDFSEIVDSAVERIGKVLRLVTQT